MDIILLDVSASDSFLSGRNIVIMVVAALIAIGTITSIFIWRKIKNSKK